MEVGSLLGDQLLQEDDSQAVCVLTVKQPPPVLVERSDQEAELHRLVAHRAR